MLEALVKDLEKFLEVDVVKEGKGWKINISDTVSIMANDLLPGTHLFSRIGPLPGGNREDLFIFLMQANYLGQGTGGSVIGLDASENFLTLSLTIVYDMNYRIFKDRLEEFVNYLSYWKEELLRLEQEAANK